MTRLHNNILIIKEIQKYAEKYPDLRFHQILQNLGIVPLIYDEDKQRQYSPDLFYEESEVTYKRITPHKVGEYD